MSAQASARRAVADGLEPGGLAGAASAWRAAVADLTASRQEIERVFVATGEKLAACAGLLSGLAGAFEQLPRDFHGEKMTAACGRLEAMVAQSAEMARAMAEKRPLMARLTGVVAEAKRPIAALERSIRTLGIVSLNARVLAAGSKARAEDVSVFTVDVAELAREAAATVTAFSRLFAALAHNVARAQREDSTAGAQQERALCELADELDTYLKRLSAKRDDAARASLATVETSRRIAARVSAAVIALQVGDSIRQRIEHVERAFDLATDLLAGRPRPDFGAPGPLGRGEAEFVGLALARVQLAQAVDAKRSLEAEVRSAREAIDALAGEAAAVTSRSRSLYGDPSDARNSLLALLSERLRVAAGLLDECVARRAEMAELAANADQDVAALLGHVGAVERIQAHLQLLSLNATLRCDKLGDDGRTLSVVAEQIRELAQDAVAVASAAVDSLRRVTQCAAAVAAAGASCPAERVVELERDAIAALRLLQLVDAQLGAASAALERDGPRVASLLGEAAGHFSHHDRVAATLDRAVERLSSWAATNGADGLRPTEDPRWSEACAAIFATLRAGYSMKSERQVHDAALGFAPEPGADPADDAFAGGGSARPTSEAHDEGLDDIFF